MKENKRNPYPAPSWASPEYILHLTIVVGSMTYMFWTCVDITTRYPDKLISAGRYERGWAILGDRTRDTTDTQWRDFTGNLPLLLIGMGAYVAGSRAVRALLAPSWHPVYYAVMNVAFVCVLHGGRVLFLLAILVAHYLLCSFLSGRTRAAVPATWFFTISVLFLNEMYSGYSFPHAFAWLQDDFPGLMRWHVTFNMSILRMISYAGDRHEAASGSPIRAHTAQNCDDCLELGAECYTARVMTPRPSHEYRSLVNYLAFILYFPTYFAGPITTFNAFMSHVAAAQKAVVGVKGMGVRERTAWGPRPQTRVQRERAARVFAAALRAGPPQTRTG